MQNDPFLTLAELLDAPGPSGFERGPARLWRKAAAFADHVTADANGNSYATVRADPAQATAPGVMLAGHIDEIGLMIVHIDEHGFCSFEPIGGWDVQVFVGQRVTLLGPAGPVPGVIGRQAVHMLDKDEREKLVKTHELWIDIGAASRDEAAGLVSVGTAGVLGASMQRLPGDRVVSRSLDNRVGAFVVLEALRMLAADRPAVDVTAVATTQEEIAYSGGGARTSATRLDARAALVVDVTHATDYPGVDKRRHGEVRLGGGPVIARGAAVSDVMYELLVATAAAEKIDCVVSGAARWTGTDADAIFTAHRGVPTGVVSVPLRYMHSPNEMVALADITAAARLLAAVARRITPETDFVPW